MHSETAQPASHVEPIQPEVLAKIDPELAVRYLIKQGLEWAVGEMDTTLKLMCKPILGVCSPRIDTIDRDQAIEIIRKIHELSWELEDKTGIANEFFG